ARSRRATEADRREAGGEKGRTSQELRLRVQGQVAAVLAESRVQEAERRKGRGDRCPPRTSPAAGSGTLGRFRKKRRHVFVLRLRCEVERRRSVVGAGGDLGAVREQQLD